jgi:hypothetical protein
MYSYVCLCIHKQRKNMSGVKLWMLTRGYKDGLQPESLADGNWLVKQNQPMSKIETISDTNLRSLYESWFRNALISKSLILWWQVKKGINSELEGASKHTQSLKHSFKKVSVSHAQLAYFSTLAKEKHMLLILNFSTLTFIFFFFWWGLLHNPQQGPDRMKEKTYKTGKRKTPA